MSHCREKDHELYSDLKNVLFTPEQISNRIALLGDEISNDYRNKQLVLISILKGGIVFLADLMRSVTIPHVFDLVGASSYHGGTASTGKVIITKDCQLDLRGKDILLVEDILDTGHTLNVVWELLKIQEPASIEACCLLHKERSHEFKWPMRYVGFSIPDEFVVGYGLDYRERYRNLPCIGVLKEEVYSE